MKNDIEEIGGEIARSLRAALTLRLIEQLGRFPTDEEFRDEAEHALRSLGWSGE